SGDAALMVSEHAGSAWSYTAHGGDCAATAANNADIACAQSGSVGVGGVAVPPAPGCAMPGRGLVPPVGGSADSGSAPGSAAPGADTPVAPSTLVPLPRDRCVPVRPVPTPPPPPA